MRHRFSWLIALLAALGLMLTTGCPRRTLDNPPQDPEEDQDPKPEPPPEPPDLR